MKVLAPVFATALLAACSQPAPAPQPSDPAPAMPADESVPTEAATMASSAFPTPPGLPPAPAVRPGSDQRDPIPAVSFWRTALEEHRFADARSVWGDNGAASGMTIAQFQAAWSKYEIIDITVGKGVTDAGAGSSFYEAPVSITGLTTDKKPYSLTGTIALRRVNDVDGASPEQLRWHIERSTLKP